MLVDDRPRPVSHSQLVVFTVFSEKATTLSELVPVRQALYYFLSHPHSLLTRL